MNVFLNCIHFFLLDHARRTHRDANTCQFSLAAEAQKSHVPTDVHVLRYSQKRPLLPAALMNGACPNVIRIHAVRVALFDQNITSEPSAFLRLFCAKQGKHLPVLLSDLYSRG